MAVIFDSSIYDLAAGTVLLVVCLYWYLTSSFNYWKDRGVAYLHPLPVFGNLKDVFLGKKNPGELYQGFYDAMKGERYFGIFEMKAPVMMLRDPELVEKVLIKDFNHFYDRGLPFDSERNPLAANLFNLEGTTWRNLRYKLTPTFTTGKLKGMFEQICNCGERLVKSIEEESKTDKTIEGKPLISDFTFEVIASVAFGLQLDKDNEDSKTFRQVVKGVTEPTRLDTLRILVNIFLPSLAKKLDIKLLPQPVEDAVMQLIRSTLNYRMSNGVNRNDFLQLMLNLQKQEKDGTLNFQKQFDYHIHDDLINQIMHAPNSEDAEDHLKTKDKAFITDWLIAAQSLVFLTEGSESISSTVNFTLYCLTQNPKIQQKVQHEIDSVLAKNNNKWSAEAVRELLYLEQVIQETLRLYPPAPVLFRICTEPYKVPDSTLVVEKGVRLVIPVWAIHNDPQNYDSPQQFNPDRFQDNNFKPSGTYLPFGDGPRICIAMRFAVLEVKMVLARILAQYTVKLSPKTKLPLTFKRNSFLLLPENGFWFEFDNRVTVC